MKDFRSSLEPGTEVITIGGIIGKVVSVDEEYEEIVIDSRAPYCASPSAPSTRSTRVPPSSMTTKWRTPSRPTKPTTRPRYRWTRRWNPPRTQRSPTIPRRPQTPRSDGERETMTQSDITIERLADVGAGDAAYLVSKIRTIPGFPKEGIKFRDFMPVLADGKGCAFS